jgi:hypothetical protein
VVNPDENLDGLKRIHRELLAREEGAESSQPLLSGSGAQIAVWRNPAHSPSNAPLRASYPPLLLSDGKGDCPAPDLPAVTSATAEDRNQALEKPADLQPFPGNGGGAPESPTQDAIHQACPAVKTLASGLPGLSPQAGRTSSSQRWKSVRLQKPWWIITAAAVTALVIACWIAYSQRRPASSLGTTQQKSNAPEQDVPSVSAKQLAEDSTTKPQTVTEPQAASVATEQPTGARIRHQHVRIRGNEVDIGEDVTVRYFGPQHSVVPPTGHLPSPSQPASRSLAASEISITPRPAQ